MKKIKLLSILLILVVASCTKMFMYSYGIRNPKIENENTIIKYLKSNDLDISNNYALKDTSALYSFMKTGIGAPEIQFFDKNGYLMKYKDDKKCNGQNDSLISFLDPQNVVKIDSSLNVFTYLNQIRTLKGESVNMSKFSNQDYYLIIYWAKWLGKMNRNKIYDWENSLRMKNNLKIVTIKLTTDYMDFWKIKKNEMFKVYNPKTEMKEIKRQ
jgi:hypothetical protein